MTYRIYPDLARPELVAGESVGYEIGAGFNTTVDGWLLGVRFYRLSPDCTPPFLGSVWHDEQLLATSEPLVTDSLGWLTLYFRLPPRVRAGLPYVVSYGANAGRHGYSGNGPEPASTGILAAGTACYGELGSCPLTASENNYYVDVLFNTTPPSVIFNLSVGAAPSVSDANVAGSGWQEATDAASSFGTLPLPFIIPEGWDYLITDVLFVTKHVQLVGLPGFWGWRNSYMHLQQGDLYTLSVTSAAGLAAFTTPLVVRHTDPPLRVNFQNAGQEVQNMAGFINGKLVPADSWRV